MRTLIAGGIVAALVSVADAGDALDRAQIQAGITKVKTKIMACGDGAKIGGTIKIRATVDAAGKVTSAEATGDDGALGACVAGHIKTAVFARTKSGGSFSYPFIFGKPADSSSAHGKSKSPAVDDPAAPPPSRDLDRAAITAGIAAVKAKVQTCKGTGKIKVMVEVAPDGKVTKATPEPADALGKCVATIVKTAKFATSDQGGTFSYPFVFGDVKPAPEPPPGDSLDRAAISDGIAKVKAKITACGKTGGKGKVKIKVKVAPDGSVSEATVEATADDKLGACVAGVIKAAKFRATEQGGAFSYPFIF